MHIRNGNIYEKYANKQKQRPKELSSPTRCPITQNQIEYLRLLDSHVPAAPNFTH